MIPLLTLGVPGSAVTAILLGSMYVHNVNPGPMLFVRQPDKVSTIFILLLMANILFVVFGLISAKYICKVIRCPIEYLMPVIALLCLIGTFCINNSLFELRILLLFGVIGYLFEKGDVPVAPMVLALVLGRLIETNFRKTLLITSGDFLSVFTRPISGFFMFLTVITFFAPTILDLLAKLHKKISARNAS